MVGGRTGGRSAQRIRAEISAASLRIRAIEQAFGAKGAPSHAEFHQQWEAEVDHWWALADELTESGGLLESEQSLPGADVFADMGQSAFPII